MIRAEVDITPFFLPGESGLLFCIHVTPRQGPVRGQILYLHPFAEEMHKSRRMAALQSRRLAKAGYGVLQLDLTGCGDSWGDFGDARWDHWINDATLANQWLDDRAGDVPLLLWGLRLGATLAVDLATRLPRVSGLLLWNPVTNGELFLNQFLRIKLASEMLSEGRAQTGTRQLRERLKSGEPIEVGGYLLAAELAEAIAARRLDAMTPPGRAAWVDVVADVQSPTAPASQNVMQKWIDQGCTLYSTQVAGESFWVTQEITECPALLEATLNAMDRLLS
ncbi:hydrolase 2, exosortase A system-associated [Allochromatium vinosum]|uniref:hydrolase 2, exosortase A system-associated n=1 Tax=Allochromatium vinosum TaxID=1049 RepID=UPI001908DB7D|nr:hydrolase 2, exosortase A system-associated [Allochromatium vinosum]MBK1655692.1 hydrolase 2, exosortase A system-associated [Allochromatium vinosum]